MNKSLIQFTLLLTGLLSHSCSQEKIPNSPAAYPLAIRAVDLSMLPELRRRGVQFKDADGRVTDVLTILQNAGCNTVRLRVWHSPKTVQSSLIEVREFTDEIRSKKMRIWITVHYSDQWADPGSQTKPSAWSTVPTSILGDSVYQYTKRVISVLKPDYIQLGNELNNGFLWPDGHISNAASFTLLLSRALEAAHESSSVKTMVHFAGTAGANEFFTLLKDKNLHYHITALSYYSRWHTKSLPELSNTIGHLISLTGNDFVIAETGYPFTLGWNDLTTNLVGLPEHLIDGFPATEEGQYRFLLELRKMIAREEQGLGFCYWAPEWVAFNPTEALNGSPWENMALFDFENKALKGLRAFGSNPIIPL